MNRIRRARRKVRKSAEERFERQRRLNLLAAPGPGELIIVLDHLKPSFNIGKIFRSADAFGVREIHLVGIDFFDPAPAKGSFKWVPAVFHDDFASCHAELAGRGYTFLVLAPAADRSLPEMAFPRQCALVLGHEGFGISFTPADYPGVQEVAIPQYGRTESLNVSIAASIAMYEYCRQHPLAPAETAAPPEGRLLPRADML